VNRADWQRIAEERLLAAEALLVADLYASAYYMAGYAVEGGLKSCILVRVASAPEVLFQKDGNKFSIGCWTHDIEKLVKLADLEAIRDADSAVNASLDANWKIVAKWDEKSRYVVKTQAEAEALYNAIAERDGVMPWLRMRW
jgi:hypothetical protein